MSLRQKVAIGAIACTVPLSAATSGHAATASPLVVPRDSATLVVAHPGATSIGLYGSSGALVRQGSVLAPPTALAVDPDGQRIYVALAAHKGIDVLNGHSLRELLRIQTGIVADHLAVEGKNLIVHDATDGRSYTVSYGAPIHGIATARVSPPPTDTVELATPIHIAVAAHERWFWAGGFSPGESVAVSWGARDDGAIQADAFGIVTGSVPMIHDSDHGTHSIALYGSLSGRSLTRLITAAQTHRPRPRAKTQPPVVLAFVPGPRVTLTLPLWHGPRRVPVGAAGVLLPLVLLLMLLGRRRKKKKKKKA